MKFYYEFANYTEDADEEIIEIEYEPEDDAIVSALAEILAEKYSDGEGYRMSASKAFEGYIADMKKSDFENLCQEYEDDLHDYFQEDAFDENF